MKKVKSITLSESLIKKIEEQAWQNKMTFSEYIEHVLSLHLNSPISSDSTLSSPSSNSSAPEEEQKDPFMEDLKELRKLYIESLTSSSVFRRELYKQKFEAMLQKYGLSRKELVNKLERAVV